ncbi:MAG: hypothetical protein [Caudoviricetes sp.]|nr:MAG: hypothetical protein [Caudoviricetes sp.]
MKYQVISESSKNYGKIGTKISQDGGYITLLIDGLKLRFSNSSVKSVHDMKLTNKFFMLYDYQVMVLKLITVNSDGNHLYRVRKLDENSEPFNVRYNSLGPEIILKDSIIFVKSVGRIQGFNTHDVLSMDRILCSKRGARFILHPANILKIIPKDRLKNLQVVIRRETPNHSIHYYYVESYNFTNTGDNVVGQLCGFDMVTKFSIDELYDEYIFAPLTPVVVKTIDGQKKGKYVGQKVTNDSYRRRQAKVEIEGGVLITSYVNVRPELPIEKSKETGCSEDKPEKVSDEVKCSTVEQFRLVYSSNTHGSTSRNFTSMESLKEFVETATFEMKDVAWQKISVTTHPLNPITVQKTFKY